METKCNPFTRPLRPSEIGLRGEIYRKWSKFRTREIIELTSLDDLVRHVQMKYGLNRQQAKKEVDAFAKGRDL